MVETDKLITAVGRKLDVWPAKDELTKAAYRLEKLQEQVEEASKKWQTAFDIAYRRMYKLQGEENMEVKPNRWERWC